MIRIFKRFRKKTKPVISETGGWTGVNEHYLDKGLIEGISRFCSKNCVDSINDLGSGSQAKYSLVLKDSGFSVNAFDYNVEIRKISSIPTFVIDLTEIQFIKKTDLTICLEVGEHVPKKYEDILIENISNSSSRFLILSWAIIGQDGHGHVNCKTNFEVINLFRLKGWILDYEETELLRNSSSLSWFQNTIFVFKNSIE
jgi:hypothetical protein